MDITLPTSKHVIGVPKLAPHVIDHVRAACRAALKADEPQPPVVSNPALGIADEPNLKDPGYIEAMARHEARLSAEFFERIFRLVARRATFEIDAAALAEYRETLADIGAPLPEDDNDKETYLYHLLCEDQGDINAIVQAALNLAQPREEVVQEHIESFPGHVSEA